MNPFPMEISILQNSQLSKLTEADDHKDGASDRGLDSSHQARVAQSLQAHDYVRMSRSFPDWSPNEESNTDWFNSCTPGGDDGDDQRADRRH